MTISLDDNESTTVETREQPVWMTQSTIDGTAATDVKEVSCQDYLIFD